MSWIDRINAAIVRRISRPATVVADEGGVEQAGRRHAYANLQRAVAFRQPNLIGDALSIALDFGDRNVIVISEHDAAWKTVLSSLDADPRSQRPAAEWCVALIAASEDARFELFQAVGE